MLAFIHMQRTGGTTMKRLLRSSFGVHHCDVESWHSLTSPFMAADFKWLRKFHFEIESIAGHRVLPFSDLENACPNIKYFTFLRNPKNRVISFYQMIVQNRNDKNFVFEDWIAKEEVRNAQTQQLAGNMDVNRAIQMIRNKEIFVGLTERYDESLLLLKSLVACNLNISYLPRERMNVAIDNTVKKELSQSDSILKMINEANEADFELYEYVKREIYPIYQREYGSSLGADVAKYQNDRHDINHTNLTLNQIHRNLIYKPLLKAYRFGIKIKS